SLGLTLPVDVLEAVPNKHPLNRLAWELTSPLSHTRTPEQQRAFKQCLEEIFGKAYYQRLGGREKTRLTRRLVEEVLPPLIKRDDGLTFLNPLTTLFEAANQGIAQSGTATDDNTAPLIKADPFWQTITNLYQLQDSKGMGQVSHVFMYLATHPQQTLHRLDTLASLTKRLQPREGLFSTQNVSKAAELLYTIVSMPVTDEVWNTQVGHILSSDDKIFGLPHLALVLLNSVISDGRLLLDHPEWADAFQQQVLLPNKGGLAQVHHPAKLAPDTFAQVMPSSFVQLVGTRFKQPSQVPELQKSLVRLLPFLLHMDFRLLEPYLDHVDERGYEQKNWGNENELMLLFRHPAVMESTSAQQKVCYAITSPRNFVGHGVPQLSWGTLALWADVAALSHSFRSLKFTTQGGSNSLLADYGFKPHPKRASDKEFGPGFTVMGKELPSAPIEDDTLIEFRRGYLLASTPGAGTLVIRNASINPNFNVRYNLLTEPAYYSPDVLTRRDLTTLDPERDMRSLLDPFNYTDDPTNGWSRHVFEQKLGRLVHEIKAIQKSVAQWQLDLIEPSHGRTFDLQMFRRGGFGHLVNRLDTAVNQEDRRLWLALYPTDDPPFNQIPYTDRLGMEQEYLPVTPDLIDELRMLHDDGLFAGHSGAPSSDFQRFIQAGINAYGNGGALMVVEDNPALY
ncbi:MAG: hypothetical protein KC475_05290, partial [Cyanobacteria bacterium HKST-UBA03]|nr:hypothetical protein [Cyanobacteria bacterium HKST-UBA03]